MFKHEDLLMVGLIINKYHALEIVARGSETQLLVSENLYKIT